MPDLVQLCLACELNTPSQTSPSCPHLVTSGALLSLLFSARSGPLGPDGAAALQTALRSLPHLKALFIDSLSCIIPCPVGLQHSSPSLISWARWSPRVGVCRHTAPGSVLPFCRVPSVGDPLSAKFSSGTRCPECAQHIRLWFQRTSGTRVGMFVDSAVSSFVLCPLSFPLFLFTKTDSHLGDAQVFQLLCQGLAGNQSIRRLDLSGWHPLEIGCSFVVLQLLCFRKPHWKRSRKSARAVSCFGFNVIPSIHSAHLFVSLKPHALLRPFYFFTGMLSDNELKDDGIVELASSFTQIPGLSNLNISCLAHQLDCKQRIVTTDSSSDNSIGRLGLLALAQLLRSSTTLSTLDMSSLSIVYCYATWFLFICW